MEELIKAENDVNSLKARIKIVDRFYKIKSSDERLFLFQDLRNTYEQEDEKTQELVYFLDANLEKLTGDNGNGGYHFQDRE